MRVAWCSLSKQLACILFASLHIVVAAQMADPSRAYENLVELKASDAGLVVAAAASVDEKRVWAARRDSAGQLSLVEYEIESGKTVRQFGLGTTPRPSPEPFRAAFNPTRELFAFTSAHLQGGEDVTVVSVRDGALRFRPELPSNRRILDLAFSSDGQRLAVIMIGWSLEVRVWEPGSGRLVMTTAGRSTGWLSLSHDGRLLLMETDDGVVLRDVDSGRELSKLQRRGGFRDAAFDPNGKRIFLALREGDGAIVWDLATGTQSVQFTGHGMPIWRIEVNPAGTRAFTFDEGGRSRVWDVATGRLVASTQAMGQVRVSGLSPDMAAVGQTGFLAVLRGEARLWTDVNARLEKESSVATVDLTLAQGGDAGAMHRLVAAYRDGRGVAKNAALSSTWLKRSADAGHAPASVELGNLLVTGEGERQDCVEGGARLRKASSQGEAAAGAALDAVLSPVGGRQGAAAMSPQIQADLLETQIIDVLKRSEYPAFLANLCALEALGHAERLPAEARRELVYHRAVGLQAAGKPRAALAALTQYLNEAGSGGANYTAAIRLLRPLQEEVK
jgi:hypothetical protein